MAGVNGTDLSNATSAYNCSSLTNSTSLPDSTGSDPSSSNTTDTSGLTPPDDSPSTDPTSSPPDDSTTTDSSALPTDTGSPAPPPPPPPPPPPSTPPPPPASSSDDGGSSGVVDPSSGQFTADPNDPEGRRKRSSVEAFISSWLPVRRRTSQRHPRLAQTDLPDVAQQWQDLCLVSGGDTDTDDPCVQLAGIGGINALLSTGGVCDQQDNADKMIDFAKSPGVTNQDALVAAAIAYRKHARNADNLDGVVPATPYCTVPPRNEELVGVVNEQLPGVNPGIYGGPNTPLVAFGADGTCPAGLTPDVSTCSCA
ncbi:hypothetical protein BC826DRAFT_949163 [Russula brevipes]|nr:hypothetical protein BC826DRAFT_949163 [Russula brevipes]